MKIDGTRIKELRIAADLSQVDIAQAADLSERRIQQIEKGERININLNIAKGIAKRLGVKLETISTTERCRSYQP